MYLTNLTTTSFHIAPGEYSVVWLRWMLRRQIIPVICLISACIFIGCFDIRYAISICMLTAVIIPFIALLLWDRAIRSASISGSLRQQTVTVTDRKVIIKYDDDDPRNYLSASVKGESDIISRHLIIRIDGNKVPLIIPTDSIVALSDSPDTF